MDDPTPIDDALTSFAQATGLIPRRKGGRKTAVSTLYRWAGKGCRGVRLRYVQVGGTRCTTRRWLREFFDALTALAEGEVPAGSAGTVRSPARRERDLARAQREAEALGV